MPARSKCFNSRWSPLSGQARRVLTYCEQAVAADSSKSRFRDSRGLAGALTGDLDRALDNFRYFVDQNKGDDREYVERRRAWIPALEANHNPIDEAELEALRNE